MKKTVYAYLHTHWDREWYKEFEQFRLRLVDVFDDVLKKLEENKIPSFYFDGQTAALEDYLDIKPEKKSLIEKFIREKRLFIGPYYCSTDSFLVDAESLIKNLQIGFDYSRSLGCNDFIAYHADTFGHSSYIPQLIKYFGINNAIFWRGLGELSSEFLFRDLKSIYLIEGYFHDYFSAPIPIEQKAKMLKRTLDRISKYSSNCLLLPIGADHLALPDNLHSQIKEVNALLGDYEIILTTPFEYLDKVSNNYINNINQEFRNQKRNFILPGVLSSRIDLKQKNAELQWLTSRVVQPYNAIFAYKNNLNYQQTIDNLYKKLIQNHAHDSIYGCSVDGVHRKNIARFNDVKSGLDAVYNTISSTFYNDKEISVLNLSNFCFNGALHLTTTNKLPKFFNAQLISKTKSFPLTRFYKINETPVTEDYVEHYEYLVDINKVDAFSSKLITASDICNTSNLKIGSNFIENDKIGLFVKNGKIEIIDKKNDKIYKNFLNLVDRADTGDSYNFGALVSDLPIESNLISSKILEVGHIRSILEINFEILIPFKSNNKGRSKKVKRHILTMYSILENQNEYIEFLLKWDNKSLDHILQVEFNLDAPVNIVESDDLSGDVIRNFDTDYDVYKHLPAPRGVELICNTAPIQKSLFAQGIGIVTYGLQEYEVFKNKIRITLLRATGVISNSVNPTRGTPAGPPIPTPDLQMLGKNSSRFALAFKDNISQLRSIVENFYCSTLLLQAKLDDTLMFETGNENVLVSTIKTNSSNDLIIRLVNKSNKDELLSFNIGIDYKKLYETDAFEQIKKEFAPNIEANSFKTIIIER